MRTYTTAAGTTVRLKRGARMDGTRPEAVDPILDAAHPLYEEAGCLVHFVVTSAAEGQDGDGVHMPGSKHYTGEALDLRIWGLPSPGRLASELQQALGSDYDVVYGPDHNTHIHVERDLD